MPYYKKDQNGDPNFDNYPYREERGARPPGLATRLGPDVLPASVRIHGLGGNLRFIGLEGLGALGLGTSRVQGLGV